MAGEMMLHTGGERITRDVLDLFPVLQESRTYGVVKHYDLAQKVTTIANDLLKGFHLEREQFAVAREGKQMFAVLNYAGEHPDMGVAVAFRNSYDKSMSVGFAMGASVFVCDNLALSGDITIMRKHTVNVWPNLEKELVTTIYEGDKNYIKIIEDAEAMKRVELADMQAWQLMGILYGMQIIGPRQLGDLRQEWHKPTFTDFQPRNLWSLYNDCTHVLKATSPLNVMDKHLELHNVFGEYMAPRLEDATHDEAVESALAYYPPVWANFGNQRFAGGI